MLLDTTVQHLREAGWGEERARDPSDFINFVTEKNSDYVAAEPIFEFLKSFGGLRFSSYLIGMIPENRYSLSLLALDTIREDVLKMKGSTEDVFLVGFWDTYSSWFIIFMSHNCELFIYGEDVFGQYGSSVHEFLNNLLNSFTQNLKEFEDVYD